MKTKDAIQVKVQTYPNGYGLTVNGEEFMYLNPMDLVAGFMAHVGLGEPTQMEKGSILSALMAAMLGESYTTAVTTLKQRVGLLTSQYNTTIERMDKAIEYVTSAEKTIDGMIKRIEAIEDQLKGTEAEHAENKKVVDDVKDKLADIDKKADKVMDSLANSATILRAMEEAGEAVKENKADEGQEEPDKSVDADGQSAEHADDGKRKGKRVSRKDADAKIIKAIAKKAKKNPNIK